MIGRMVAGTWSPEIEVGVQSVCGSDRAGPDDSSDESTVIPNSQTGEWSGPAAQGSRVEGPAARNAVALRLVDIMCIIGASRTGSEGAGPGSRSTVRPPRLLSSHA